MNAIREEDIFETARQFADATARTAYLERACAGDGGLRARVDRLLSAVEEADQFFTDSRTLVQQSLASLPKTLGTRAEAPAFPPGEEPIGTRIGRYKLLQKIGEGGCGMVYLAEQEEPVRRRVALKIIKLGMETKSVVARFEAERQALAMMDHPNIAHVFDAGATHRGPPYFVMELVRGVKITEYCDENRIDLAGRLNLFTQICHAIQHAHQKGVIHGDIKPSNIMVTLHDGVPVPKVIDFGISKATEASITDKIMWTTDGQLIGTPAYMSPEQAELGAMDIDTRSDIYSLGVLLYELLTGKTPFDPKELVRSGIDAMRRTLRETEPLRPSARLKALPPAELMRAAVARQTDSARLLHTLHGDLDWIVMKALEKDRQRRFETANGLAVDVQRHLNNEPVIARPPSRLYRFQKLVRRNRVVFAAGGAVALALVLGTGTSTWLFLKERDARQRAVAAEQQQARLRHVAELRDKIRHAALLVNQEKFDEADGVLSDLALAQPTIEGAAALRAVGEWHMLQHRWRQAADRFAQLVRINQLDSLDVTTLDYLRLGPALIELGNLGAYDRFRREAIARYASGPCPLADRIVKISLLLPAADDVMASLESLGRANAESINGALSSGDEFMAAWRAMSLGLLEYRRTHFAKAIEWSERTLACPEYNGPRNATAHLIFAMASQQLGRADLARRELKAGRDIVDHKFATPLNRGTPTQGFWFDWLFARVLLREAAALIDPPVAR